MSPGVVVGRRYWGKIGGRAKQPGTIVALGHKQGSRSLLKGVHPKVVSEMLGHASIAITLDLYSHVLPDMQRDAVQAMASVLNG
jgi:site-specific recombinase XerD